jgi:nucleotide-binding universal stress UspA family protein
MEHELKNILVPTDFSNTADNALRIAAEIAGKHKANIHLLNIVSINLMLPSTNMMEEGVADVTLLLGLAQRQIESLGMELFKKHNLNAVAVAELGAVSTNVCAYVVSKRIDMVVMGSHGISGWNKFLIGSNAMSVIQACVCPVLTVPLQYRNSKFKYVLYPVRNAKAVMEKYNFIKAIAWMNDACIHLLGVIDQDDIRNMDLLTKLKAIRDSIFNQSHEPTYEIMLCKNIAYDVMEKATEKFADLVVINASIDVGWTAYFSGNHLQQIVNHAVMPVLSFKS